LTLLGKATGKRVGEKKKKGGKRFCVTTKKKRDTEVFTRENKKGKRGLIY